MSARHDYRPAALLRLTGWWPALVIGPRERHGGIAVAIPAGVSRQFLPAGIGDGC
jgi:hypothetical protein